MPNDPQITKRAIPSPREERVGRGLGRGATHPTEPSASSPQPSPPSDGGEGVPSHVARQSYGTQAIPSPRSEAGGEGQGEGRLNNTSAQSTAIARLLRRNQTDEEKQLWHALKAGRFAGFKFRRQHKAGDHYLDFYCPTAKLSVELDGFQHGLPEQMRRDEERRRFLDSQGIEELRFWNHQWQKNREGVLLKIWDALHRRTGCIAVMRKVQNHRFIPPNPDAIIPIKRSHSQ